MQSISKDLNQFDQLTSQLFQFMKRPSTWAKIASRAAVSINRPGAYIIKTLLHHGKAPLTITQLSTLLGVEAPSISREVSDLESLGFVKRIHQGKDKRTVYIKTTPKAEALNKKLNIARQAVIKPVLEKWNDSERKTFIKLFSKYVNELTKEEK